jgi:type VI secretion system protein ImpG
LTGFLLTRTGPETRVAQDNLEKAFLAELEALEKFRISYTGLYKNTPLAREDPDIRRLIEAMAMFTARTRLAATRSLDNSLLRIFRQHFPYLLDPMPAMTMLRAESSSRYVDVTELPRGTEVYLIERAQKKADERMFRMRTMTRLRILPIAIESVDIFRTHARTYRLLVRFEAAHSRKDEIGDIPLYINHLDDLPSSLTVLFAFKAHLQRASVVFDGKVNEETVGQPCDVHFGMPETAQLELRRLEHPLQLARSFVHYPRQELYINLKGIRAPRNWQRFTVVFDMKDTWPTELRLTTDAFNLHVVPMVNLREGMADPIEHNGTKERHLLQHPDTGAHFVLQRLLAVYRMTDKGLIPLEPGVVGTQRESYEVAYDGKDEQRRGALALHMPSAFDKAERVAVDALWYQPSMRGATDSEFRVKLADRHVDGVQWSCGGPLSAPGEPDLVEDRDGLLQLLSIKNQRFLGTDDLIFLLGALGATREPFFAGLIRTLSDAKVTSKPLARQGSHGFKYIYELTFDDLDATDLPRLDLFCGKLLDVLAAWSVEEVVEIVAKVRSLEKTLTYPPPAAA